MVNTSNIPYVLLDIMPQSEASATTQQILEKSIPVIIRKLNCFGAAVYQRSEKGYSEAFLFPQGMHRNKAWQEITAHFIAEATTSSPTGGHVKKYNTEYYCFELGYYGKLILGRAQAFTDEFYHQLSPIIFALGTQLA